MPDENNNKKNEFNQHDFRKYIEIVKKYKEFDKMTSDEWENYLIDTYNVREIDLIMYGVTRFDDRGDIDCQLNNYFNVNQKNKKEEPKKNTFLDTLGIITSWIFFIAIIYGYVAMFKGWL